MPTPKNVYQIKVTLKNSKPPIWRRILVPEDITLFTLHEILQRVMSWQNYHLHMFTIAGQIYGDPEDDDYGDSGTVNEKRYRLNQLGMREQAKFSYEYDFGDSWEHTLLVEKILPADPAVHYPVCVTGKRACPPEDVGGIWGYEEFLEVLADPGNAEHESMLEWAGGEFDPEEFDLDAINQSLQHIKPTRGRRKAQKEPEEDFGDDATPSAEAQKASQEALVAWVQNLTPDQNQVFESLPLRRDVLTFLDYLSKNRTVGTQSTGNLPLKAVQDICLKFVNPVQLEETINGHTYKVRSEDEVWQLLFIHQLAFHSGMVTGGPAKIWKVTAEGQMFPQLPPPVQSFLLFIIWWTDIDWTIAFPVSGLANGLPDGFKSVAFACLQELTLGENAPFEPFADRLIKQSGLTWPSIDQTNVQSTMRAVVKRTVVDIMEIFSILECEYVTENSHGYEHKKLANIRLTPIGKGLLSLMK
ncbi:MAG: plasmid pRiA4b ORF-3 family protein [Chloroflexi bacterium]|nr:MAG: plasmid pRiA4b ORF-3 family protein [Chloroflexota bacterium]